ncbi:hypothetical protein M758_2G038900 [Ceratodon purpureus]|nr:hypothetical protein M758_2G038900 [Ceratodon purpureus]
MLDGRNLLWFLKCLNWIFGVMRLVWSMERGVSFLSCTESTKGKLSVISEGDCFLGLSSGWQKGVYVEENCSVVGSRQENRRCPCCYESIPFMNYYYEFYMCF